MSETEILTLGEVAQYINGRAFKPNEWEQTGLPIIRIQNLNNSSATYNYSRSEHDEKFLITRGDLLYAWSASLGAYIWEGQNGWLNQHIFKVVPKPQVDKKYLYYYLTQVTAELYTKAHGSGMVHVTKKKFESTNIPIPSLDHQKLLVAKIEELFSELDNGIASLKTAQEQLKIYRQALLKHAFEGKLTEQWRKENADKLETPEQLLARIQQERGARYQEQMKAWKQAVKAWEEGGKEGKKPRRPGKIPILNDIEINQFKHLSNLPVNWNYVRLGSLIDTPTYGTSTKSTYESGGVGVLRIPNIANGRIKTDDLKFASLGTEEIKHLALKNGDLLTIRSNGSISIVGSCALIREKDIKHIFAGYLIRLRPIQQLIFPSFLLHAMSSYFLRLQIEMTAKSTSGVNNINSGELQNLIISISSLPEQEEIVRQLEEKLSIVEQNEKEIEAALVKAELLRQAILKKAFCGELV